MNNTSLSSRGFTLLLAALVASIVLSIGTAIYSIAQKQVTLASLGRDSQYAFYAADTAAECALFWDDRPNTAFSTQTSYTSYFATTTPTTPALVQCAGNNLHKQGGLDTDVPTYPTPAQYAALLAAYPNNYYDIKFDLKEFVAGTCSPQTCGRELCAQVDVRKWVDPVTQIIGTTTVTANGFNVACSRLSSTNAIERTIELGPY